MSRPIPTTAQAWACSRQFGARDGYTQTLQYNASNQLATVTDSFGRTLSFTYLTGASERPAQYAYYARRVGANLRI